MYRSEAVAVEGRQNKNPRLSRIPVVDFIMTTFLCGENHRTNTIAKIHAVV
jgi:hypothetical protein